MSEDESYIVKPRDVGAIVRTADKDALTDLFEDPLSAVVESVNGWLASGPKEWSLATGRIVQGALKARLFQQVAAEINEFRKKGKIADDFAEREKGFQTWVELFTVIDEETPDEERLEALKAMFYAVNKVTAADVDRIRGYQLFQIAKKLSSNDLLILKRAFELRAVGLTGNSYKEWAQVISANSGNMLIGLIDLAEANLVQYRLLTERYDTAGGVARPRGLIDQTNFRLTDLGIKFCENIVRYQIDKKS